MAHDEALVERIRALLHGQPRITEQRMFGGVAFLLDGHMAIAASGQGGILVRVDPDEADRLIASDEARPMVMRGRQMRDWVRVAPGQLHTNLQLSAWIHRGMDRVRTVAGDGARRSRRRTTVK